MSLLSTSSFDDNSTITLEYSSDSTAVITPGAGRKGTAGVVTNGTTFFTLDRATYGQAFESLELFRGIAFKLDALPGATGTIFQFQEADSTDQVCIGVLTNGTVRAFRGNTGGATLASSASPIAPDVSYHIEARVFIDNAAGRVVVKLAEGANPAATIIDFTGDTLNGGTGLLAKVKHGLGLDASWDDAYLCDAEGSAFNALLGNKHIEAHVPNNVGFYTNWVPTPTPPNWSNVNEIPPNADTTHNFAPDANPASAPTFRSVSSSTGSTGVSAPAGVAEGDLVVLVIRTNGANESSNVVPDGSPFTTTGIPIPTSSEGGGVGGLFLFDPFTSPGSYSSILWCTSVFAKLAGASEPASYGPFLTQSPDAGEPLENVVEIVAICFQGVNQAIPIEGSSASVGGALRTQPPPTNTIEFAQVNALTDNDLIIAIEMTESQVPATPSGYTNRYGSSLINISTKLKATAGGEIPPSTMIGAVDTWGTACMSVKARAQIETGGKDTFPTSPTTATAVSGAMVKLCTKVDTAGHTVGAVMRQASTDSESFGVAPTTDYLTYQFPYELAPDGGAWSAAKYNASESGYALDAAEPPIPPEDAVLFWVNADDLDVPFNDNDPITSIVETGMFGLTLSPAAAVAGDFVLQTFQTSVAAVNNQDSIEGITESLACTPATRNTGYLNTATVTGDGLFLPGEFTLVAVFNLTQYEGCWQNGQDITIIGRKGSTIANFCGWQLDIGGAAGFGQIEFKRFNAVGTNISRVASGGADIVANTTYIVTVICDGTTLKMRLDGVEIDTDVYATSVEPLANNQLNFLQEGDGFGSGDAENPPQGQVPYVKIWSIELQPADLAAEEAALATKYQ